MSAKQLIKEWTGSHNEAVEIKNVKNISSK